jgi:hypothetical protein
MSDDRNIFDFGQRYMSLLPCANVPRGCSGLLPRAQKTFSS